MKVPFLTRSEIESKALRLIYEYGQKLETITGPPIPVAEIIDCHFDISLKHDDLNRGKQGKTVLGSLNIEKNSLVVEESLDPYVFPHKEGRYRFTLAHEAGHWILHRPQLIAERKQQSLFGGTTVELIVCRTTSKKEPIEWQADNFAAYLLMPKEMVFQAWQDHCGDLKPYVAEGEIANLSARFCLGENETPTVSIAKEIAGIFKVSGQSMQIRLAELGLVRMKEGERELFQG